MNKPMLIITDRLTITEFDESMIEDVQKNSLDEDNRRFVPDEVFETVEDAKKTVAFLMKCYKGDKGPFVYPLLLMNGDNIGYVQAVPLKSGWEIGYHIAKKYTGNGYATEAVKSFLPIIMEWLCIEKIEGHCLIENIASCTVLEKCGFTLVYKGIGDYQGEARDICRYLYERSTL